MPEPPCHRTETESEEIRRQQILESTNGAFATLRNDPEAWSEYIREREEWDAALTDGLDDE